MKNNDYFNKYIAIKYEIYLDFIFPKERVMKLKIFYIQNVELKMYNILKCFVIKIMI